MHAQLSAGIPIEQILARYEPEPTGNEDDYGTGTTMHEYASDWLERRRVGEIGDGPLHESTYQDYLWRLKKHVLPFFGPTPVARISDADCRRFRGKLFKDSDELKKIAAAGGRAEDENGRQRRPLSPRSIQMVMRLLGHSDYRMTLRYAAITDSTVFAEFAAALQHNAERYPTVIPVKEVTSSPHPMKMLPDVVRLVQRCAADNALDLRVARALVQRLRRLQVDLRKFLRSSAL